MTCHDKLLTIIHLRSVWLFLSSLCFICTVSRANSTGKIRWWYIGAMIGWNWQKVFKYGKKGNASCDLPFQCLVCGLHVIIVSSIQSYWWKVCRLDNKFSSIYLSVKSTQRLTVGRKMNIGGYYFPTSLGWRKRRSCHFNKKSKV